MLNVTLSVVCSPKSTAVAATPLVVNATSPCAAEAIDEPETIPAPKVAMFPELYTIPCPVVNVTVLSVTVVVIELSPVNVKV